MPHVESLPPSEVKFRRPRRAWLPLAAIGAALGLKCDLAVRPRNTSIAAREPRSAFAMASLAGLVVLAWFLLLGGFAPELANADGSGTGHGRDGVGLSFAESNFRETWFRSLIFAGRPIGRKLLEAHRTRQRSNAGQQRLTPPAAELMVSTRPNDVLAYRGPRRDGVVEGPVLARDWSTSPPRLVWRQPAGGRLRIVRGGRAARDHHRAAPRERGHRGVRLRKRPRAMDPRVSRPFQRNPGRRWVRATPTVYEGKLYSLGGTGILVCLDLATRTETLVAEYSGENASGNLDWGMSGSPLVDEGRVLVNPGTQKGTAASRSVAAFDAADGKLLWSGGLAKASYSSPISATFAGQRQLVIFDAAGLAGHESDGRSRALAHRRGPATSTSTPPSQ